MFAPHLRSRWPEPEDCDQIHALYAKPGAEARRQILEGFYFNSWRGGEGSADRLLSLLREIDVGEATNPDIDRTLDYLPASAWEMAQIHIRKSR